MSEPAIQIRDRIVDFRRVRAGDLAPNPKNWRTHPKQQRDALAGVLAEIGYADALLARQTEDGRLELVDGHLRAETTPDQQVPVLVLDLSEREADLMLATLDPLAAMAGRDDDALSALLRGIEADNEAVRAMLADMVDDVPEPSCQDPEPRFDEAEALLERWMVQPGDLWALGPHRLLCGDSAEPETLDRIFDQPPRMVFTDPPYGVAIGKKNRMLQEFQRSGRNTTDITDDACTPEQLRARLLPAFRGLRERCADDCTYFVCAPQGGELGMMMMMQDAGLPVRHVLIWRKNQPTFSMGRLDYDYQHEPILLTWTKRHRYYGKGSQRTSVWDFDKPRASAQHPTMKPVELVENALLNNSLERYIVADIYCGSGTTLMACERLGRICRAVEIEPRYCALTLQRWADATGQMPQLIEEKEIHHGTIQDIGGPAQGE